MAKKLSIVLAKEFPYERAYLFGSVLKKGGFTRHSDIDIVIKGLDEALFLKAYAFLLGQRKQELSASLSGGKSESY